MQKQATLLLVDDHEVVRAGIRNALHSLKNVIILDELGDGKALFMYLEEQQPDCLLIDVTMPNFNAIHDLDIIHKTYPDMKILVVSAYDDDVYVQGLLGIGVNGYHLKDQPLSDLRLAVERILDGEKWVSSRLVDRLVNMQKQSLNILPELTIRQGDILRLLHQGLDNRSIALELGLSVKTVENHLTRLYKQLGVHSRLEAVNYIIVHPEILASQSSELAPAPRNTQQSTMFNNHSILVVDDNARYRQQFIRMITSINGHVMMYEAGTIESTLKLIRTVQPHLVFVDVVLGDESGIHCVKQIRNITNKPRLVLFSAYPDVEFHRQGIEAGAIAFLDKKNLDLATLRQILDDMGIH